MNCPLVTVVCNCYNHAPFVVEALQSVENQCYKNIEIIVLDNGSSDESDNVLRNYLVDKPHIKYVHWEQTVPITIAFNRMTGIAQGEYFIDLSGDDVLLPHCVASQINTFLASEENVAMVYGNAFHINETGEILSTFFETDTQGKVVDKAIFRTNYLRLTEPGVRICSVSAMMKRKHFELLGGYDENLFFEDLDYWYRLSREYKITFINDCLVKKRKLTHSLGEQIVENSTFTLKIHASLYQIYRRAISYNCPTANRNLLKRLHYHMATCYQHKLWKAFAKYAYLEIKCRWHIIKHKGKPNCEEE